MFKFLDPYLPIIYGAAIVAVLGGLWWYGKHEYNKGYAEAAQEATTQVAKERVSEFIRQGKANAEATTAALETITRLELSNVALQQTIESNKSEAKADPTAGRECLSPGSVRRLNAIR